MPNRTCSHLPATVIIQAYGDAVDALSQAIIIRRHDISSRRLLNCGRAARTELLGVLSGSGSTPRGHPRVTSIADTECAYVSAMREAGR